MIPVFDGSRLREIRERRCLTLKDVASRIGVRKSSVSNWELGRHIPSSKRILPLAEALSCSASEFFSGPQPVSDVVAREATTAPLSPFPEALLTFDAMPHELDVMIELLGTAREEFLGDEEPLSTERARMANDNLWGAELGLQHLHDAYRRWVDDQYKSLKEEVK